MSVNDVINYSPYVNQAVFTVLRPKLIPTVEKQRLLTFSKNYNKPVRFTFQIFDHDLRQIAQFNCWDVLKGYTPELNCYQLEVFDAFDQTGSFNIGFYDHEGILDERLQDGNWVVIKIGRDENKLENIMYGIATDFNTLRDRMDQKYHQLTGFGSQLIFAETKINMTKVAKVKDIATGRLNQNDENLFANNVLIDMITNEDYPMDAPISIRDRGNFSLDGINPKVSDFLGAINNRGVNSMIAAKKVAELSLAYFKVNPYNSIILDYPNNRHSGKVIKAYDENDNLSDFEDTTSYFHGQWNFIQSSKGEQGYANVLISDKGLLKDSFSNSTTAIRATSLWNKDLAQQCTARVGFRDLALLLSKKGVGSPNLTSLHGHIHLDRNNLPIGSKVLDFNIPLESIAVGDTPTPIFVSNFVYNPSLIQDNSKIWIILYERGDSEENTVFWWHDNDFVTPNRFPSATRPLPNGLYPNNNHNATTGWQLINPDPDGFMPQYTFSIFRTRRFRVIADDPLAIKRRGRVVTDFKVPWSDNLITTSKALHAALYYTAKSRLDYFHNEVFIPTDYYFPIGDLVTVIDPHSRHTQLRAQTGQIMQRSIRFDARNNILGTHFMNVMLSSYHNPLYDEVRKEFGDSCEV